MTSKQLEARLFDWLLKPVTKAMPHLRTDYWLEGDILFGKGPFGKHVSVRIDALDEIGVETTDQGPFMEDVFWVLRQGDLRIRIGDPHPIFKALMERFGSLEGFDWKPFIEAQSCSENRYFSCWKRKYERTQANPG